MVSGCCWDEPKDPIHEQIDFLMGKGWRQQRLTKLSGSPQIWRHADYGLTESSPHFTFEAALEVAGWKAKKRK